MDVGKCGACGSGPWNLGGDPFCKKPTYLGDALSLQATVEERLESRQVVVLQFRFMREKTMVAKGRVSLMICNVERPSAVQADA